MQNIKQHIVFKISTLVLVLALLTPSAVKFTHIFKHHQHEVCKGEITTHVHTLDIDCNFYKFKLNTPYAFFNFDFQLTQITDNQQLIYSQYAYMSDYQELHFYLRGPPRLV